LSNGLHAVNEKRSFARVFIQKMPFRALFWPYFDLIVQLKNVGKKEQVPDLKRLACEATFEGATFSGSSPAQLIQPNQYRVSLLKPFCASGGK
jgi:hypothetical protein